MPTFAAQRLSMANVHRVTVNELNIKKLYSAVNDPMMKFRLEIQKSNIPNSFKRGLDKELNTLSNNQWKEICEILKIEKP